MTPERWQNIIDNIKDNYEIYEHEKIHFDEEGGIDVEYIVFQSALGKMKLEFIAKPVVLDKKTTYSKRIGSETQVEYVYSQDAKSHRLKAYRYDEGRDEWQEVEAKNFA